jgi:hypothetical protein
MRRELDPGLLAAYRRFADDATLAPLAAAAAAGHDRWLDTAHALLRLYREQGSAAAGPIEKLLDADCACLPPAKAGRA